jgi:hypothetical protein
MNIDPYNHTGINSGAHFDGQTYSPELDHTRLTLGLRKVYDAMSNGRWWSLHELSLRSGVSELSIGSRVRDLRKPKFGSHKVDQNRISGGLYMYRLEIEPQRELAL